MKRDTPFIASLLAGLLMLTLAAPALADSLEDETRRIAKQLQCPVCESVSVADSPVDLAIQMRNVIRAKLEAGESESQIMEYFVERYGDQVLVEPPRRGLALAVWWAPLAILLGGAGLLFAVLRSWQRGQTVILSEAKNPSQAEVRILRFAQNDSSSPPTSNLESRPSNPRTYEDLARTELEQYRREVGG